MWSARKRSFGQEQQIFLVARNERAERLGGFRNHRPIAVTLVHALKEPQASRIGRLRLHLLFKQLSGVAGPAKPHQGSRLQRGG